MSDEPIEGEVLSDDERIEQARTRYVAAMHGVQSAIAYAMSLDDPDYNAAAPKHMRVGVDSAHITLRAHANLLIERGIFTEVEYLEAITVAAETELREWEERYSARGLNVSFR